MKIFYAFILSIALALMFSVGMNYIKTKSIPIKPNQEMEIKMTSYSKWETPETDFINLTREEAVVLAKMRGFSVSFPEENKGTIRTLLLRPMELVLHEENNKIVKAYRIK